MEDFNSKYTGEEVENILDSVGSKQDAISDLQTIREGAAKGATAVQPVDIEDVARLDEEYVVANGIVSKQDVYYHLPNTNTSDAAHTLATKGDLSSTIETYIADFTIASLREGIYDGIDVECDIQALVEAMNANKIILVRDVADSTNKGVYVLNGYAEDLLYFSIVDTAGDVLYCDGTDYVYTKSYINCQTLFYRNWVDKQDTLVSGENIKTINGENILGSGDITIEGGVGTITGVSVNGTSIATSGVADIPAASTSKYGVTKLTTLINSSSTTLAATASAVKIAYDLANSKQDKLESGTNIKTINGASILGSGDITISGGSSGGGVPVIAVTIHMGELSFSEHTIPLEPDKIYYANESIEMVYIYTVTPPTGDVGKYSVHFTTTSIVLGFECPQNWLWANGTTPTLEPSTTYELSVVATKFGDDYIYKAVLTPFKAL